MTRDRWWFLGVMGYLVLFVICVPVGVAAGPLWVAFIPVGPIAIWFFWELSRVLVQIWKVLGEEDE